MFPLLIIRLYTFCLFVVWKLTLYFTRITFALHNFNFIYIENDLPLNEKGLDVDVSSVLLITNVQKKSYTCRHCCGPFQTQQKENNIQHFLFSHLSAPMYEILELVCETKAIRNAFIFNSSELKVNV